MKKLSLVDIIVQSHSAGEAHAEIARRLGVSRQYVGSVVTSRGLRPGKK